MSKKILPSQCPSCEMVLRVQRLGCPECGTAVEGDFALPILARLSADEMRFVLNLVKFSGSLKDLARVYGVSYPTVRNRLDALIDRMQNLEEAANGRQGESENGNASDESGDPTESDPHVAL